MNIRLFMTISHIWFVSPPTDYPEKNICLLNKKRMSHSIKAFWDIIHDEQVKLESLQKMYYSITTDEEAIKYRDDLRKATKRVNSKIVELFRLMKSTSSATAIPVAIPPQGSYWVLDNASEHHAHPSRGGKGLKGVKGVKGPAKKAPGKAPAKKAPGKAPAKKAPGKAPAKKASPKKASPQKAAAIPKPIRRIPKKVGHKTKPKPSKAEVVPKGPSPKRKSPPKKRHKVALGKVSGKTTEPVEKKVPANQHIDEAEGIVKMVDTLKTKFGLPVKKMAFWIMISYIVYHFDSQQFLKADVSAATSEVNRYLGKDPKKPLAYLTTYKNWSSKNAYQIFNDDKTDKRRGMTKFNVRSSIIDIFKDTDVSNTNKTVYEIIVDGYSDLSKYIRTLPPPPES